MRALKVLFLCTGNSCRSQMAEGFARLDPRLEPRSAGVAKKPLDPRAVRAMAEAGVDISRQRPKTIDELGEGGFDLVVTVCSNAKESCPVLPGAPRTLHAPFDDPPLLARGAKSEEEAMAPYRRVRDEIRRFVAALAAGSPETLQ